MISARWLEKRKPYWDRLESIVQRSGRGGLGALSHEELRELGLLYRQVAADLSSVREDPMSQRIAGYLNQLLGRAHNLIYMGRRARPGGILEFYRGIFPRIFRETFKYTLAAFAVFLGAAVAGFLICLADPSFQRFLLGPRMRAPGARHRPHADRRRRHRSLPVTFIRAGASQVFVRLRHVRSLCAVRHAGGAKSRGSGVGNRESGIGSRELSMTGSDSRNAEP